jgi:hypothetical protein
LVEQANETVERMLSSMIKQTGDNNWVNLLPIIMFNLHTQKSSSTKYAPYKIVFNQNPNLTGDLDVELPVDVEPLDKNDLPEQVTSDICEKIIYEVPEQAILTKKRKASESEEEDRFEVAIKSSRILRERVNKNQDIAADKMSIKHDKKRNKVTMVYNRGDYVTLKIPRIDRGSSDLPRLPCQVISITGTENKMYELATVYGILDIKYSASDLELYHGVLVIDHAEVGKMNKISLHEAANLAAKRLIDAVANEIICNCKGNCLNNRCACRKAKQLCSSHCHLKGGGNKCCENVE